MELYMPFNTLQPTCGNPSCAIEYSNSDHGQKAIKTARRRETLKMRQALKTRSDWMAEAQSAFNAFIRERDKRQPCISCGTMNPGIQYAAGHYKSVGGHPELRFEPLNVHRQCNANCNMHKSGNLVEYRKGLIERIGIKSVEWLEGPHDPKHYTIDDLKCIKRQYKKLKGELARD